jgi:hypothetical protein
MYFTSDISLGYHIVKDEREGAESLNTQGTRKMDKEF